MKNVRLEPRLRNKAEMTGLDRRIAGGDDLIDALPQQHQRIVADARFKEELLNRHS